MLYLVDANNLACQLFGTAGNGKPVEGFDAKLIELYMEYNRQKRKNWALVFDPQDDFGDKFEWNGITVIYAPRDRQHRDADDKIIELAGQFAGVITDVPAPVFIREAYELTVITDDVGIIKAVRSLGERAKRPIHLKKASDLANELLKWSGDSGYSQDSAERGLSGEEIDDINSELLELWK